MPSNRRLAAIMFTDIAGYTAMMQANELETREKVKRYKDVLSQLVSAHGGEILQHYGDGSLTIFSSAVEAVRCAKNLQQEMQKAPTIPLRAGIHIGDVYIEDDQIYGDGVNLASRVESLGVPGAVLLTERVVYDIKSHPEFELTSMGQFSFKNVKQPMEVFAVQGDQLSIPKATELKGKATRVGKYAQLDKAKMFTRGMVYGFAGVLVGVMIWLGYSYVGKNSMAEEVAVTNEDGKTVMRLIPKLEHTRRIVIFPSHQREGGPENAWKGVAVSYLMDKDIEQDMRVYSVQALSMKHEYESYNRKFLEPVPLSVYLNIARDYYSDFFVNSELTGEEGQLTLSVKVHQSSDGKLFYENQYQGRDLFEVSDKAGKELLEKVCEHEDEAADFANLPVNDLVTGNLKALEHFIKGSLIRLEDIKNIPQAITELEAAIELDPNCSECYLTLSGLYFAAGNVNKAEETVDQAENTSSVLPERQKLNIRQYQYRLKDQTAKQVALLELWRKLYPNDLSPYQNLISFYKRSREWDKAKKIGLAAIENGHKGTMLTTLAELYIGTEDYEEAEKYMDAFAQLYPHKAKERALMGEIYLSKGEIKKAEAFYEEMLLLNSNEIGFLAKLALTKSRQGEFEAGLKILEDGLKQADQPYDSVNIYSNMEYHYYRIGQYKNAFSILEKREAIMDRFEPAVGVRQKIFFNEGIRFIWGNWEEEFKRRQKELTQILPDRAYIFTCMGDYLFYLWKEDQEKLKTVSDDCKQTVKRFGGPNFKYVMEGAELQIAGKYEEAIQVYEVYLDSTGVGTRNFGTNLLEVYRKAKKYDKALEIADDLIKVDPYSDMYQLEKARVLFELGKKEEAQKHFEIVMKILKNADEDYFFLEEVRKFGVEQLGIQEV